MTVQREIKFRVWDTIEKEMLFPETVTPHLAPLQQAVLMQFSGLIDKNGVCIYEGDIIKIAAGNPSWTADPFEVIFLHGAFQIKKPYFKAATAFASYLSECLSHGVITDDSDDSWLFEVIGNIYQTPELLK